MKKHFGRQVIEAPRHNSSAPSAKVRHYGHITLDDDGFDYDGFTRLPVSRKQEGYNTRLGSKSFTDKIGPLRRYLKSCCGRLWDDVYSEIARELGRSGSEGIRHIKDQHINVATNTYRGVDGNIYSCDRFGVTKIESSWRAEFYVEPETGILRESPITTKMQIRDSRKANTPIDTIFINHSSEYRKIDGIWYRMDYGEVVTQPILYQYEVFEVTTGKFRRLLKKSQLGKKELRNVTKLA